MRTGRQVEFLVCTGFAIPMELLGGTPRYLTIPIRSASDQTTAGSAIWQ